MYIGSDDETVLINAIDSNFPASNMFLLQTDSCFKQIPASNRFLLQTDSCFKQIPMYQAFKDGTVSYLQTKVSVPQKEGKNICKSIFWRKRNCQ